MQLLLFWIIQLHCSPRTMNAKWFATMNQVKYISVANSGKTPHAVKAPETLLVTGAQPHTAKPCLLLTDLGAEVKQGQDTCTLSSSTTLLWLFMSPPATWELHFFTCGSWKLNAAVHFSNCFFLQCQVVWGSPLTMMPLCLHAVRADPDHKCSSTVTRLSSTFP